MPRGGTREGAGRKPVGSGKRQDLKIYLDPKDNDWIRDKANDWQLSLSAVIALALACLRKHTEEWPK